MRLFLARRCCEQKIQFIKQTSDDIFRPLEVVPIVPRHDTTLVDLQIGECCLPQSVRLASLHQQLSYVHTIVNCNSFIFIRSVFLVVAIRELTPLPDTPS